VIEFDSLPVLTDPVMIAAFEGWNDAGEAASSTITHLREVWQAEPLTELDSEEYYDYQVNRPHISVDESGVRQLDWPSTQIFIARVPLFPRDIVLVQGIEPNMKWQQFTREILGLAAELDVTMVVTVAALLSDSPHTRPVPVTGSTCRGSQSRAQYLRGAHGDRRGCAGSLRSIRDPIGLLMGSDSALRWPASVSEGHAGSRTQDRGHLGYSRAARRSSRGGPRLGDRCR